MGSIDSLFKKKEETKTDNLRSISKVLG